MVKHRGRSAISKRREIRSKNCGSELKKGDKVCVAIRPEKLSLSDEKPEGIQNSIKGKMDKAAYLGERSHYYVNIEGISQPVAISAQNRQRAEGQKEQNRPVWLSWDNDAFVVLERDKTSL